MQIISYHTGKGLLLTLIDFIRAEMLLIINEDERGNGPRWLFRRRLSILGQALTFDE
jgi:hypothetical protein